MDKFESVYRVLLSFMLIDNNVDVNEKAVVLEFLNSKFGKSVPKDKQVINYHKDKLGFENFRKDALVVYESFSREEIYEILDFIGKIIKSDGDIDSKEVMLFENLLEIWKVDKVILETFGIKKSLWSKFFE